MGTIEKFIVRENNFTYLGAESLGKMIKQRRKLNELCINGGIPIKSFFSKMGKIKLSSKGYKDTDAIVIASLLEINNTVKELNLDDNHIGNKGIEAIGRSLLINSTLATLSLKGNKFSSKGAKYLG